MSFRAKFIENCGDDITKMTITRKIEIGKMDFLSIQPISPPTWDNSMHVATSKCTHKEGYSAFYPTKLKFVNIRTHRSFGGFQQCCKAIFRIILKVALKIHYEMNLINQREHHTPNQY